MDTKTCTRCKEPRDLSSFWKLARSRDGLASECKPCQKERNKAFYQANQDRERARAQEWRLKNPERAAAVTAVWRANNEDRFLAMKAAYRVNNPEKVKAARCVAYQANKASENAASRRYKLANKEAISVKYSLHRKAHPEQNREQRARRKARERRATPAWANRFFMAEAYRLARLRTSMLGHEWQVDHIVPIQSHLVCGLHCEANLSVVPAQVNLAKSNTHWPDMPV